jgi:hypothetical protein
VERALVERYGWSLYDIDRTDMESLIPFVFHSVSGSQKKKTVETCCDQVDWL